MRDVECLFYDPVKYEKEPPCSIFTIPTPINFCVLSNFFIGVGLFLMYDSNKI